MPSRGRPSHPPQALPLAYLCCPFLAFLGPSPGVPLAIPWLGVFQPLVEGGRHGNENHSQTLPTDGDPRLPLGAVPGDAQSLGIPGHGRAPGCLLPQLLQQGTPPGP